MNRKRYLAMILAVFLALTLFPTAAFAATVVDNGTCGSSATWSLDSDGVLTISGTGAMADYDEGTEAYAPWYESRLAIQRVVIGNGITRVGSYSFLFCENLTQVSLPEGLETLGKSAFRFCFSLGQVTLPNSLVTIESGAFDGRSPMETIHLPANVASVGNKSFVVSALKSITVDEANPNFKSVDGVLYSKDGTTMVFYPRNKEGNSYTIPNGVTRLFKGAFKGCNSLTSVTIPATVTTIEKGAFSTFSAEAPSTVRDIYYGGTREQWNQIAIDSENNANLSDGTITIHFESPASGNSVAWSLDGDGVLTISGMGAIPDYYSASETPWFSSRNDIKRLVFADTITEIGNHSFEGCSQLSEVSFSDELTRIGKYAFSESGITELTLPAKMNKVQNYSFQNCVSLTNVVFPNGFKDITRGSFHGCTALKTMTIPASVEEIESEAFSECGNLETVYYEQGPRAWRNIDIGHSNNNLVGRIAYCNGTYDPSTDPDAIVPNICGDQLSWSLDDTGTLRISGEGSMYNFTGTDDEPWSDQRNDICALVVEEGVTTIGSNAFNGCANLTTLSLPNTVVGIGSSAFRCCGITSLVLPSGNISLGKDVFSGCTNLQEASLPNGFRTIPSRTFEGCQNLTSVTIPVSVDKIKGNAFAGCDSIQSVYYYGGSSEWANIDIQDGNEALNGKVIYQTAGGSGGGQISKTIYGDYILYQEAQPLDDGVKIRLTENTPQTFGGVWFREPFSTVNGLQVSFDYKADGGDGMVLVFSDHIGFDVPANGGDFGFQGQYGVELDGFYNVNYNDPSDGSGVEGHIEVIRGGVDQHVAYQMDSRVADGTWHTLSVRYQNNSLSISLDGNFVLSCSNVTLSDSCYIGINAANGGLSGKHTIQNFAVSTLGSATIPVSGVTLNKAALTLTAGASETLTATVSPSDATNKSVTWTTSDASVATVSNGTVTAVGAGTATITATTADGGKTATCTVTVTSASSDTPASNAPLKLVGSYNKATKTATLSLVTTEAIVLSNYDVTLTWDNAVFTLSDMTNAQPSSFANFQKNKTTGKIAAASGGDNVSVAANEILATYALTTVNVLSPGDYRFSVSVQDASNEEGNALEWKGQNVNGVMTVSALSTESFDCRASESYTLDYTAPVAGDFTVTAELPCVVLCSNGTSYQKLIAAPVSGNTYSYNLPDDYDVAEKIIIAVKADFNGDGEISSTDALQVLRCAAGNRTFGATDVLICDINGDGELTSTDTLQILRIAVGLRTLNW